HYASNKQCQTDEPENRDGPEHSRQSPEINSDLRLVCRLIQPGPASFAILQPLGGFGAAIWTIHGRSILNLVGSPATLIRIATGDARLRVIFKRGKIPRSVFCNAAHCIRRRSYLRVWILSFSESFYIGLLTGLRVHVDQFQQ